MKKSVFQSFRRRFRRDDRGNVAMMVAVSVVPLTLAAMGALDLTRSVTAKVALQDALDAAALAAGRVSGNDATLLQQTGQRVLQQNLSGTQDFTVTSATFTFGANGTVVAAAQATFQPSMAGLFGAGPAKLAASSEVTRSGSILEIALVLDNTGSMGQSLNGGNSKISYLITAASNFVDSMSKAAGQSTTPNSVQISLVPFANMVRVDSSYQTAAWIDGNGVSPINNEIFRTSDGKTPTDPVKRFSLFDKLNTTWAGCVEMRKAPYDVTEVAPTSTDPASLFTPFFAPDETDTLPPTHSKKSGWTVKTNSSGNNYVADPITLSVDSQGNTVGDWRYAQGDTAKYSKTHGTLSSTFGPNDGCGMQKIHRLTTDFTGLKTSIGKMVAVGETDIPLGLFWGWMTLSPNAPFADGVAYNTPKHKKIVVLMTDGQNTMSTDSQNYNNSHASAAGYIWQGRLVDPNSANGAGLTNIASTDAERTAAFDARLKLLCTNMKDPKVDIEIYTVGVGVSTESKALLQSCASDASHYFDVTSGSAIDATFQAIAGSISALHLSK
jgi:Flp pilus assembly protein TadG